MSETFEIARKNMVVNQLRPNKINEENILQIFENTPKENYLDVSLGKNCYQDNNLDITDKRGYLKNLHLAQIIKYSKILPNDKVLHIGGLTGYFSALISSLCKELHVVEENRELFKLLEHNINNTDNTNIRLFNHNLLDGLSDQAPFNLIIIDGPIFKITPSSTPPYKSSLPTGHSLSIIILAVSATKVVSSPSVTKYVKNVSS